MGHSAQELGHSAQARRLTLIEARAHSPNQLDKRQQIIDAAKTVLIRDGLEGCTTRAVSAESPLTRSAIHYYFESAQEIVDAAMDDHLDDFIAALRDAGRGSEDPVERFWATIDFYLGHFRRQPRLALLWFDYSIQTIARGRSGPSRRIDQALHDVLHGLLLEAGVADPSERSGAVVAYMIGTTMRQLFTDVPSDAARVELATLAAVPDR
ncbi:MAG: TetR/AcrR family transcriptional regulator [Solirubrobacteraceae bacterium]